MDKKVFSASKAGWHLDRIQGLRDGLDVVPVHLQLIISDLCNQNCHFCAYRMDTGFSIQNFGGQNPNRKIPTEKCKEILTDFALMGGKAVEFTGGGEPTVHPDHIEIFQHAIDLGLDVGVVTNGVNVKPNPVWEQMKWVRVSMDAGTKETYEKVRDSKTWNKALDALQYLGQIDGPLVGVGFVATLDNYKELFECCAVAKSFGIPYVRVSAMFSTEGSSYYADHLVEIHRHIQEAMDLRDDKFDVVNFFGDRLSDLDLGKPDYEFCGFQQFTMYIGGDQKVYTCCTNAYTTAGEVADLTKESFRDFLIHKNQIGFDARSCHHCQFNDKNREIGAMIVEPPHVNFV